MVNKVNGILFGFSILILFSQPSWGLIAFSQKEYLPIAYNLTQQERAYPLLNKQDAPQLPPIQIVDNFDYPSEFISTWWDIDGMKVYKRELTEEIAHSGTTSMEVKFRKGDRRYAWSFFAFQPKQDGIHNDFSEYDKLIFWIKVDKTYKNEPLRLKVKLEDKQHNGYEKEFELRANSNWQMVEFNFSRAKIDLTQIDNVLFFADGGIVPSGGQFWLDDIYLLKEEIETTTPPQPGKLKVELKQNNYILSWEDVGANLYEVWASCDSEFKEPIEFITDRNYLDITKLAERSYYFKVRALSQIPELGGKVSGFSEVYEYKPQADLPPLIEVVWSQAGADTDNVYPIGALVRLAVKEKYNAEDIVSAKARITSTSTGYNSGWIDLHLSESKDYYFCHWNTLGLKPASDYQVEFMLKDKSGEITRDDSLVITLSSYLPIVISPVYKIDNLISFKNFLFNISYDPNFAESEMGKSWIHSYMIKLKEYADGLIEVNWAFQGSELFQPIGGGQYKNIRPGIFLSKLWKEANEYLVKDKWGRIYRFNEEGNLITIKERNGNETKFTYEDGLLKEIIAPYGLKLEFQHREGYISKIRTPYGREIEFYYSGKLLSEIKDTSGRQISLRYSANDYLEEIVEEINGKRKVTYLKYDERGRLKNISQGYGVNSISYRYYDEEARLEIYKAGRFYCQIIYNTSGQPIYFEDALGGKIRINYDERGLVSEIIDKNGNKYKFEYDESENVTKIIDPLGKSIEIDYHPEFNLPVLITDSRGGITRYEYDERGNLTKLVDPLANELIFEYDDKNLLTKVIDQDGNEIRYFYDEHGNLIKIIDQLGYEIKFEFEDGLLKEFSDPFGNLTEVLYKAKSGLISGFKDPLGFITQFAYNSAGEIKSLKDPLGRLRQYVYDDYNRLSEVIYPDESKLRYEYDQRSRLIKVIDREGNEICYEYDELDRIKAKIYPDGRKIEFGYDPSGNLIFVKDGKDLYRYEYDELNRLIKEILPEGSEIGYEYDGAGNLTKIIYPDGTEVIYTYDLINRLEAIFTEELGEFKFIYGEGIPRLKLGKLIYPNKMEAIYDYNQLGKLTEIKYLEPEGKLLKYYQYEYDPILNKTKLTSDEGEYEFRYDAIYQLTYANTPDAEYKFEYDGNGNRKKAIINGEISNYEINELDQIINAAGNEYIYDANGNLIEKIIPQGKTNYIYDYDNRLIKVIHPDGSQTTYKYDYLGRRVEKNHNGKITRYIYAGWKLIMEVDTKGNVIRKYINLPQAGPIACMVDGEEIYYLRDGSNNITAITDKNGRIIEEYKYTPFGQLINEISGINEVLFESKLYDRGTGLYYSLSRYYSPELGRFIQEDPEATLIDTNLYAFANNNPINFDDPYGTCLTWINPRLGIIGGHGGGGKFSLWGLLGVVAAVVVAPVVAPVLAPAVGTGVAIGTAVTAGTLIKTGIVAGAVGLGAYGVYYFARKHPELFKPGGLLNPLPLRGAPGPNYTPSPKLPKGKVGKVVYFVTELLRLLKEFRLPF